MSRYESDFSDHDSRDDDYREYGVYQDSRDSSRDSYGDNRAGDHSSDWDPITDSEDASVLVARLYQAAFGRLPDDQGLNYWSREYAERRSGHDDIVNAFIDSPEYESRYGSRVSSSDFVDALYSNVLGRNADAAGLEYWVGTLESGLNDRGDILAAFANSAENQLYFSNREYGVYQDSRDSSRDSYGDNGVGDHSSDWDPITGSEDASVHVARLYQAAFGRLPDDQGLNYWSREYAERRSGHDDIVNAFIDSPEYESRYGSQVSSSDFVDALYSNVLGRNADAAGLEYWVGTLESGLNDRGDILAAFANSVENKLYFSSGSALA